MAARVGVCAATVARAEDPGGGASLLLVEEILAVAGLRLAVVDAEGRVVTPMREEAARNRAGRRFPAHLDTRVPAGLTARQDPWRYDRPQPTVTFLRRDTRPGYASAWAIPGVEPGQRPDDHFTEDELAQHRALIRERYVRPAQPWEPWPECACGPECESTCHPDCDCQCEPEPRSELDTRSEADAQSEREPDIP